VTPSFVAVAHLWAIAFHLFHLSIFSPSQNTQCGAHCGVLSGKYAALPLATHTHTHTDTVDLVTVIRQTPRWLPLYLCATAYACECVCVSQNLLPLYLYIIIMPGWQTKCWQSGWAEKRGQNDHHQRLTLTKYVCVPFHI